MITGRIHAVEINAFGVVFQGASVSERENVKIHPAGGGAETATKGTAGKTEADADPGLKFWGGGDHFSKGQKYSTQLKNNKNKRKLKSGLS